MADTTLMNELRSRMTTLYYTRGAGFDNQPAAVQLVKSIEAVRR
jgi:hypothetical protein